MIWLIAAVLFTNDPIPTKEIPLPVSAKLAKVDPNAEFKWLKTQTKNFVILGIDLKQVVWVRDNIENIKNNILLSWDLPNIDFDPPIKIVLVPNKTIMTKAFNLDVTFWEYQDDTVLSWMLIDNNPADILPVAITPVCLAQLEKKYNFKFGFWLVQGMSYLNGQTAKIRQRLGGLNNIITNNHPAYKGHDLLTITAEQWSNESIANQSLFDTQSIAMVLLIKREFGTKKFIEFSKTNDIKNLGFSSDDQFDSMYRRYMQYLSADAVSGRMPDKYIKVDINRAKRSD